jgi:hypothetical protein
MPVKDKSAQIADLVKKEMSPAAQPSPLPTAGDGESGTARLPPGDGAGKVPSRPETAPSSLFDDDEGESEDEQQLTKTQRKTLREFAAEHGFSVKSLMGLIATEAGESDEPLSFGQLRDHWKETRQYQAERAEFDDWRSTSQDEIMTARRQVQDIFERIAGVVPPETMARVWSDAEYEHAQRIQTAKAQLLELYPQWRDPEVLGQAREAMTQHLSRWGFTGKALASIQDPMIIKYIQDSMRNERRLNKLLEGQKEQPKALSAPPSKKGSRATIDERARALAAKGDKASAVALLVEKAYPNEHRKS